MAAEGDAADLFRYFPSDGIVRPGFCADCKDLSLARLLGQQADGTFRGFVLPKTIGAVQQSAASCQFCHSINFAIGLSTEGTTKGLDQRHAWLRPVQHARSYANLKDLAKLNGLQIIHGDLEYLQSLTSGAVRFILDDETEVEDYLLGYLRFTHVNDQHEWFRPSSNVPLPPTAADFARSVPPIVVDILNHLQPQLPPTTGLGLPKTYCYTDNSLTKIATWLQDCEQQHDLCAAAAAAASKRDPSNSQRTEAPKRLLQITTEGGLAKVRLHQTGTKSYSYVALSHCWGTASIVKTTLTNISQHFQDIPLSTLPTTFRDAVELTRQLGLDWLWIDSLCIIQDDPTDWAAEAPRMNSVYSEAYLTIAASASSSANGGCFPRRPAISDCVRWAKDDTPTASQPFLQPYPADFCLWTFDKEPLQTRCWTLQERLLSRRVLHCSSFEYICFCHEKHISTFDTHLEHHESWELPIDSMLLPSSYSSTVSALRAWAVCVADFNNREITYAFDKPVAIHGLASHFAAHIPGRYSHGMFESDNAYTLAYQVGWSYVPHSRTQTDEDGDLFDIRPFAFSERDILKQRSMSNRAPSWSWLSVDGTINCQGEWEDYDLKSSASDSSGSSTPNSAVQEGATHSSPEHPITRVYFEKSITGPGKAVKNQSPYPFLNATGPMFAVKPAAGTPIVASQAQSADEGDQYCSNIPSLYWKCADGQEIMGRHSLLSMDDPQFHANETLQTKYHALVLRKSCWLLLAEDDRGLRYRRIGTINQLWEIHYALADGDEGNELSEWGLHLDWILSRAEERTIIIY